MVKLPKKVKVGGHWVKVEYPYPFRERGDVTGLSCADSHVIMVCGVNHGGEVKPDSSVKVHFLHELLHQMEHIYLNGQDVPEAVVAGFAEGIFQLLQDNHLEFLMEK